MDRFEYVFSLIGLLLGLSLVEVLSGLVKTHKARATIKVGWLTPMLGTLVILHVTSFWGITWGLREFLPPTIWQTLGAGVAIAGAYYFAAASVFPDHLHADEDLDAHYWQHKRGVVGIILGCSVALHLVGFLLGREWWSPLAYAINVPAYLGMIVVLFAKGKRVNLIALSLMNAILVVNLCLP